MALFVYIYFAALCICSAFGSTLPRNSNTDISSRLIRYRPGSAQSSTTDLTHEDSGVFVLGTDGVVRSFAANLSVVDYRQLDPSQIKELAGGLAAQAKEVGIEVSPVYTLLLNTENHVDGRLVTDLNQLLYPTDPMHLPNERYTGQATSPVRNRAVEALNPRQVYCNWTCSFLAECFIVGCYACFFPYGPPTGYCFSN